MDVIFFESYRDGGEHEVVNGCILRMLRNIFKKNRLYFFAQNDHQEKVKNFVGLSNIIFKPLCFVKKPRFLFFIVSWLNDMVALFRHSFCNFLIFSSVNPLSFLFIRLFSLVFNTKIAVVCHGELENLITKKSNAKWYQKFFSSFYRFAFNIKLNDRLIYLILGESIYSNLLELGYSKRNVIAIDHPYFYREGLEFSLCLGETVRAGSVGVGTIGKGTNNIFELAKTKIANKESRNFKFFLIGKQWFELPKSHTVNVLGHDKFLSREQFEGAISSLDYFLFFYPVESYKLIASGAFFDAINQEKPIIALKNDFFSFYFRKFGDLGYLCENVKDMVRKMEGISNEDYCIHKQNIIKAKSALSLSIIQEDLRSALFSRNILRSEF